jgi:hypothetical protein
MDGFLVLIGVLSTLHATPSSTPETRTADVLEGTRLATIIVCDAIREHRENRVYFEVSDKLVAFCVFPYLYIEDVLRRPVWDTIPCQRQSNHCWQTHL